MRPLLPSDPDVPLSLVPNEKERSPSRERLWRLYEDCCDELTGYLRKRYGDGPPDPSDIVQSAFEKLSQHKLLDSVDNLKAYIWSTAHNLMRNEFRGASVRKAHLDREINEADPHECDRFDPERVIMAREELDLVLEVLDELPSRRRDIFLACRIDGLNPRQAGEKLGISRSSAVRHLALASEAVAKAMKKARARNVK